MLLKEFISNKGYLVSLVLYNDLYTVYVDPGCESGVEWTDYHSLGMALDVFNEKCCFM